MAVELEELVQAAAGTRRELAVHRFGLPGARPKAYVQAGLHGDELPGILVASHLVERLAAVEADGRIAGEVLVVPVANPIGVAQRLGEAHPGRYDLADFGNFNRGWPDLFEACAEIVAGRLGADPADNIACVRETLRALAGDMPIASEQASLRRALLSRAIDADIVLDLHCDLEAVVHLYLGTPLWPAARDLAGEIGAWAVLLAECSGGDPFDEACSAPWWRLAGRFPDHPLPPACLAATIEYRGLADVEEELAAADAEALIRFLVGRGVVLGPHVPRDMEVAAATPLAGAAFVRAPSAGLVEFLRMPGEQVEAGDPVVRLVSPPSRTRESARTTLAAPVSGVLYARARNRLARPGDILCKIAGQAEFRRGHLLSD